MGMHVNTDDFMALTQADHREMLRIGVTGHIGLDPSKMDALMDGIARAVKLVEEHYEHRTLTVFSPLAKGADRRVAREIMKRPDARLIAVLPVPPEDFTGAELRQEFQHLLQRKALETIVLPPCLTRDESYAEMGFYIAKHCDVMIAVWDAYDSQGLGGTGDIVRKVIELGKPIVHIWAGNYKDNEKKRTDVGGKHGKVRYWWESKSIGSNFGEWQGEYAGIKA
jgi:hypothetical protein